MVGIGTSFTRVPTPKTQVFKRVWYSPPVLGGQLDPKRIEWSDKTSGFRDAYASTKTLLPYILEAVNKGSRI
jgi:hypothetical protein